MSQVFQNLKIDLDESLEERLQWLSPGFSQYRILRKSVDARRSSDPHFIYSVEVFGPDENPPLGKIEIDRVSTAKNSERPVIVGSGPAGLFAALRLVERGIACVLLERGSEGGKRIQAINRFWRYGELNPDDNVCFGEGGAGLYSDGKLITRIKSPHIPYVMDRLVQFGAPEEIRYLSNPHVGSDRIRRVIPKLRAFLLAHGCEIHFNTKMTRLLLEGQSVTGVETHDGRRFHSSHVVLATGHSAEEIFSHLDEVGVALEGKSYALGLRIEHPQKLINQIQYRAKADHPALGAANYKLTKHDEKRGIGVYSFCMCPGGYVLSSGTSADGVVSNGMSNYNRNSPFANAAIVVSVDHQKRFAEDRFGGLKFRRELETRALDMVRAKGGGKEIPVQRVVDFLKRRDGPALPSSSPSGVIATRLDQLLPNDMYQDLCDSLEVFHRQMRGFISEDAQFHAVESRTSCPIRIPRTAQTLESISHRGLFPCGEGAGYAGGITSAACDGIRVAEAIVSQLSSATSASFHV